MERERSSPSPPRDPVLASPHDNNPGLVQRDQPRWLCGAPRRRKTPWAAPPGDSSRGGELSPRARDDAGGGVVLFPDRSPPPKVANHEESDCPSRARLGENWMNAASHAAYSPGPRT